MKKEMLINVLQPEECRIATLEDGVLEELYVERTSHESYVGNIYKGRVVNIEPSIQAAFVDFGVGRNGFLHVSDVEPAYYKELEDRMSRGGRDRGRGRDRRHHDDYDQPRRDSRPPREEAHFDDEGAGHAPPPAHFSEAPPEDHSPAGQQDIILEEIYDEPDEFTEAPEAKEMPSMQPAMKCASLRRATRRSAGVMSSSRTRRVMRSCRR